MTNSLFFAVFSGLAILYLAWGWRILPREQWQVLASVPRTKQTDGSWQGVNFTYYGLLTANAYALSIFVYLLLTSSIHVPIGAAVLVLLISLFICVPASRWVARLVEGKQNTFTIGGASFLAILFLPLLITSLNLALPRFDGRPIPFLGTLAAISIAYAIGESLGRLACVSFGCCYGKPVDEAPSWIRPLFRNLNFRFEGPIKKASYEGKNENRPLVPVQAVTSTVLLATALIGIALFLAGHFAVSLLTTIGITQAWRLASEFLRADFRGTRKFTAYQWMAAGSVLYVTAVVVLSPASPVSIPSLSEGFSFINVGTILLVQGIWAATFIYTGRSTVTGSTLNLHVRNEQI